MLVIGRARPAERKLPIPDNCKTFVETFRIVCKSKLSKNLNIAAWSKEPPRPHVLQVGQGLQDMLDAGVVSSRAELARRMGVSRARVT